MGLGGGAPQQQPDMGQGLSLRNPFFLDMMSQMGNPLALQDGKKPFGGMGGMGLMGMGLPMMMAGQPGMQPVGNSQLLQMMLPALMAMGRRG